MNQHILISPVSIPVSSKKVFRLNLNEYRNAHYHVLNQAKINYKSHMSEQISKLPKMSKIGVEYRLFVGSRRRCDVMNICSIVDKFFCDALTELGKIMDDDYDHLPAINYRFGGYDKNNPRVEIIIEEL